jgi:8-oxo-dGTP diphosphatase
MPADTSSVSCKLEFTKSHMNQIKLGIIPEEMEEKWFIYFEESQLYIHRSWSGICLYIVKFDNNTAIEIIINNDENFNPSVKEKPIELVNDLINNLLLRR